jgi:hypothetical protein
MGLAGAGVMRFIQHNPRATSPLVFAIGMSNGYLNRSDRRRIAILAPCVCPASLGLTCPSSAARRDRHGRQALSFASHVGNLRVFRADEAFPSQIPGDHASLAAIGSLAAPWHFLQFVQRWGSDVAPSSRNISQTEQDENAFPASAALC